MYVCILQKNLDQLASNILYLNVDKCGVLNLNRNLLTTAPTYNLDVVPHFPS